MKLFKGLLALVIVGVVAGFVMSLIAPAMQTNPFDLGDEDLDDGNEDFI